MHKLNGSAAGYGDYLAIAILNKNDEVISYLLTYAKTNSPVSTTLMNPSSRFSSDSGINDIPDRQLWPFVWYLTRQNTIKNNNLAQGVLHFYQGLLNEPDWCAYILHNYLEGDITNEVFEAITAEYRSIFNTISGIEGISIGEFL
jgi:hypothetical protein